MSALSYKVARNTVLWVFLGLSVISLGLVIAHRFELEAQSKRINELEHQIQERSKALHDLQKEKADVETTLEKQRQEEAEKQRRIEKLEQELQARAELKRIEAIKQPVTRVAVTGNCVSWMQQAGVTDTVNASFLIHKESGCNPNAVNPTSGACGIPQALPCSKIAGLDAVGQIKWMQNYVNARYGGWAGAVSFWHQNKWY